MTKEDFVRQIAKNLDLPEALIERMTEPRPATATREAGWKIVRLPWPEELRMFGLEERFAAVGWRTALRSIIED
jgi:hypothetical protein